MPSDVLIVYGSSKGHTGRMAEVVGEALEARGVPWTAKTAFEASPGELAGHPFVVLGSSTYGQGDLQRDFLEFERGMDDLDLDGSWGAVFGSGNTRYAYFAEAVDILEAKLRIQGARILVPSHKQDMMTEEPDGPEFRRWAEDLADAIRGKLDSSRG